MDELMWKFLEIGGQKANPKALKEYVNMLITMMKQKTSGQRNNKNDIDWNELDMVCKSIIIEAMSLVLDEDYKEIFKDE